MTIRASGEPNPTVAGDAMLVVDGGEQQQVVSRLFPCDVRTRDHCRQKVDSKSAPIVVHSCVASFHMLSCVQASIDGSGSHTN